MRKEVLLAISIGFFLGLVITFGIYRANRALKEKAQVEKPATTSAPTTTPQPLELKILEPENNLVVYDDEIEINGETASESVISILAEDEQQTIFQIGKEGTFSAKIKLVSGANDIKIVSFTADGEKTEKDLTIVLSSTKIEL